MKATLETLGVEIVEGFSFGLGDKAPFWVYIALSAALAIVMILLIRLVTELDREGRLTFTGGAMIVLSFCCAVFACITCYMGIASMTYGLLTKGIFKYSVSLNGIPAQEFKEAVVAAGLKCSISPDELSANVWQFNGIGTHLVNGCVSVAITVLFILFAYILLNENAVDTIQDIIGNILGTRSASHRGSHGSKEYKSRSTSHCQCQPPRGYDEYESQRIHLQNADNLK